MTSRVLHSEPDKESFIRLVQGYKLPCSVSINDGRKRSIQQNRLQRLWMNEIASQLGEDTPEGYRGYCKAWFGLPILCEDEDFAKDYDEIIRPLTYEQKIKLMALPMDFPITRLMNVAQKQRYLDKVYEHFTGLGVQLSEPGDF